MAKSRLLMKEQPIVIDKELATIIGLNEAIILQQIEYWININEKAKKESHFQDGYYWTYNTVEEWQEEFPFWSYDTVKRTLKKLRDMKILITNRFNKKNYDRTLWYRINYEILDKLDKKGCEALKTHISAKCPNGIGQIAPMEQGNLPQPIPKTSTKTTKISSRSSTNIDLVIEFESNICKLRPTTLKQFNTYCDRLSSDTIETLIAYCAEVNINSFAGFKKVSNNFLNKGLDTGDKIIKYVEDYRATKTKERESKGVNKKAFSKKDSNWNYNNQRSYDFESLENKFMGWYQE